MNNLKTGHQWNRVYNYISDCDLQHDIPHFYHTFPHMGFYIFDWYRLCLKDIPNLSYILVCNLVVYLSNPDCKNKRLVRLILCIDCLDRKAMVNMDFSLWFRLVLKFFFKINNGVIFLIFFLCVLILRGGIRVQYANGSPVYPVWQ